METYISENLDNEKLNLKYKKGIIFNLYKTTIDIIISLIGITIGIPFVVISALCIKIEDGGPIFYKQERIGKKEKKFYIYKIRSMKVDAEKNGIQWAEKNDSRITKVGNIIRKTRIDEIPQFINILKGDMSLIGPRPERPELTYEFNKEIPGFINRLIVKPGLTGLAQVNGGYDMTPKEKLDWDMYYIKNQSITNDIKIILKTISVIITGNGAR